MCVVFVTPGNSDISGSEDTDTSPDSAAFSPLFSAAKKRQHEAVTGSRCLQQTTGCKTGSGQHENRKERIPETGGGSIKVALERPGGQAD